MTVKELKNRLEQYDDDSVVIMSRDPEGNGYSPLYEIGEGHWDNDYWEYSEEREKGLPCISLWPA